ncbi:hypothetical protein [Ornithinibacillus halotolerans]|uniref:Uncharacterized protein n=1 Tax=Ornithinibacillus halotolerans TaxID=1274357 RepID=A0A916S0D4_9BACI|nr:hypothetical protein [Ornithinibacillus halotolerans]GGA75309.1 hypothetical protein GCM10008025_18740 [Ornithinibacillus halotolerans]
MNIIKRFFTSSTTTANKKIVVVYVIFRVIAVFMLINQIPMQRWGDALLLILTLVLFAIPQLVERVFKIEIPNLLELIIIVFIFSSTILGELSDFYGYFKMWDTALHTLNGFLAAGIGFSLVYLLNRNAEGMNLSPIFLAIVTFFFSMTVGVMWEFFEYSADRWGNLDMQKDRIVQEISSVSIDVESNAVYRIEDIQRTVIESKDPSGDIIETVIDHGYLDIGIIDTMKDLFVNLIGAIVFSVLGYLYARHDQKKIGLFGISYLKKGSQSEKYFLFKRWNFLFHEGVQLMKRKGTFILVI